MIPDPRLPRPIFIIGCNRSGTTLLFNNLSTHPAVWSWYIEAQDAFHHSYPVDDREGERLVEPPGPDRAARITDELFARAHNKEAFKDTPVLSLIPAKVFQRPLGRLYKPKAIRLVEKTPANSLRVPFLHALFPDARFLFLVRRGEEVVSSLMEGWKNWSKTGDNWHYTRWHYLVPPGWQDYRDRRLEEICAFQWIESTRRAWEDLSELGEKKFMLLRHEDLMRNPPEGYARILEFCGLPKSPYLEKMIGGIKARVFTTGGSQPRPAKWKELHGREIESVRHLIDPVNAMFFTR